MPLALIVIGTIMVLTALRGDPATLGVLIVQDFKGTTGTNGYGAWMFAILVLGALGYVPKLQPISRALMVLVLVVLLVHNQGFFVQLQNQFFPAKQGT